jgi:hypothetical protein
MLAIPGYLHYREQSRQAEVRRNLGAVFASELAFYGENSRFSNFSEIGFGLAGSSNVYTYRAMQTTVAGAVVSPGPVETLNTGLGSPTPDNTLFPAASTGTGFTATATANLDRDATVDQWHVNDLKQNLRDPDINDVAS